MLLDNAQALESPTMPHLPNLLPGILRKTKQLRFAEEVDVQDISPCSPGSPVPMDTSQCLRHYHHMQRRAAAGHSGRPRGDGDLVQRGRSRSMSLLPDVPSPLHSEQSHAEPEFEVKIEQQAAACCH